MISRTMRSWSLSMNCSAALNFGSVSTRYAKAGKEHKRHKKHKKLAILLVPLVLLVFLSPSVPVLIDNLSSDHRCDSFALEMPAMKRRVSAARAGLIHIKRPGSTQIQNCEVR